MGDVGARPEDPLRLEPETIAIGIRTTESGVFLGMKTSSKTEPEVRKSEQEWRKELTPEQYHVLREKGTERAFTGETWNAHDPGTYICAGCGNPLFSSDTKFESGTGWPSFWKPLSEKSVSTEDDSSFLMRRTEVLCQKCGGHLGHVFDDGPEPTGQRYCMNSCAMKLEKK
jgi:peptide-methionine (R)-S-oxide reductase